jgi:arsenite methyltransferase
MDDNDVKNLVKEHYGQEARRLAGGGTGGPVSADLYGEADREAVPAEALQASLGCGNPAALADLRPGEVVLDMGSGGGIDVLLSARRVGPGGRAYGLDMTEEMLALAQENKKRSGLENAEFLKGEIEDIPLPDGSVDVIISNCVINLSADKARVLREAFRVLRSGGRLAVSDIVMRGPIPAELRQQAGLWPGCFAGALEESDYRAGLEAAGFTGIEVQPTRAFTQDEAHDFLASAGLDADRLAPQVAGKVISAFVRAVKP